MKLSEQMAVMLHRMMWRDMQRELGDKPDGDDRIIFKKNWIRKHFGDDLGVENFCFLCDYAKRNNNMYHIWSGCDACKASCPIKWPHDSCCSTSDDSIDYQFSPISAILALPARNPSLDSVADPGYHEFREGLLGKHSGLPASAPINDHVAKIKEKAVEEYFESKPAAKLISCDVDNAFKQYGDEVKAPIFRALAEASGLSASNESVKAHISKIRDEAKKNGRLKRTEEFFKELSVYSGVKKDDWRLLDHVEAIQIKERENSKPMKEANSHMSSLLNKYKDRLSDASGLERDKPIDEHLRKIFSNGFEAGKEQSRDLLLDKIEEILGQ